MCGLTGYVNLNCAPVSPVTLKKMTEQIVHRGPDDEGYYTKDNVAFGHRRLAILDLSPKGRQPMQTADGRYVMVYNGEIYNFRELRTELESQGCSFHSHTDSEVLLTAFATWGTKALNRLNGMFAFAIWDSVEQELYLARDRYGIKPLYYFHSGKVFLFGSEIKSFLPHPNFQVQMDPEGLLEYFTFQNFFTTSSLFKGVHILPAGTWMKLSTREPSPPRIEQYWDYSFSEPENPGDDREYLEELDRLFVQAVNKQLVSDVELGSYLSGGMDSGSITAVAATQLPYIKTFTGGFDLHSASGLELAFDEREKAEFMSYKFKTEHYEMVMKAGDMERILPALTWHLEEPRVGQSYPNFYVSQLASKFVKVVLAGTGGDELFAGYPWRYYRAVVNDNFEDYVDKYYSFWQRLIPNRIIRKAFSPIQQQVSSVWTRDIFGAVFSDKLRHESLDRPEDYVNHSLYFEAKTFLHGLLVVEDKLSMAHSLETRVPFLDNDLVDFAMKVPARLKLGNLTEVVRFNENEPGRKADKYFNKTHDGKLLLRKMMSRHIPDEITSGVKQGFSAPDASWFKGESLKFVRDKLYDSRAIIFDFLDRNTILELVDEHLEGKQNRRLLIWSLLNVEHWCEIYLKGGGRPPR